MFRAAAIHVGMALLVLMIVMPVLFTAGPRHEGDWFPVTSPAEIVSIQAVSGGNASLIYVVFEKYRDCEFIGLSWSEIRSDGVLARARIDFRPDGVRDDTDVNRVRGRQSAGPWLISLPPELLVSHSFAVASHRCHPFWLTKTRFYR